MRNLNIGIPILAICLLGSGCSTGLHGTFVSSTYAEGKVHGEAIGEVNGTSSQTWFLYIFPIGDSPSTSYAINDAKQKIEGTNYLSDVSIDDQETWKVGYLIKSINVNATARK